MQYRISPARKTEKQGKKEFLDIGNDCQNKSPTGGMEYNETFYSILKRGKIFFLKRGKLLNKKKGTKTRDVENETRRSDIQLIELRK